MVDPNPARGMPLQLQRYWLAGKGAAKIRWNMPGDFLRCVRQLTKYFPKNPKGLCNILHTKATGGPPGHGSAEHSMTFSLGLGIYDHESLVAAQMLMEKQPKLGHVWAGPLAALGRPTEEPRRMRILAPEGMRHRALPLPLDWRERDAPGHAGSVTVGRILGIGYGPDHDGDMYAYGWGDWLDEDKIPEAGKARYLAEQGVAGASIDPGGQMVVTIDPKTGAEHVMSFTIGRATLVSVPAFSGTRLYSFSGDQDWPDDDPDMVMELESETGGDCGCGDAATADLGPADAFTVNTSGWRGLPLAPRDAVFDNDDAIKRIAAWANVTSEGADVDKLRRAFLWYNPQQPPTITTSYRLPVGDVINGELTMVYHAIYAAAALLSGAHGGLPDVSEEDVVHLRNTISDIYPEMAKVYNDSSIRAPWDRSAQEGVQMSMDETFAATKPYGDVKYADPGYQKDKVARYPVDTPDHIRAAWAYINVPKNAGMYTDEQLADIKGRIKAAAKKAGIEISDSDEDDMSMKKKKRRRDTDEDGYSMTDSRYPIEPPAAWFSNPKLGSKTPLTVTAEGQVFGHIAAWGECHRDFASRNECVLAPRSKQEYAPFHLGTVYTAEGEPLRVGKIVMDTRHADIGLGYTAAAVHYDDTGDEVAVVRAGEDDYGIWVAGALVPEATPTKAAKLRRSPISGDWRRVDGNLELTAALAVNVPAFPVYSMENGDQMALVAAGTLEPRPDIPTGIDPDAPPVETLTASQIAREVLAEMARVQEAEVRAERVRDLSEDEEIYAQRERESRYETLVSSQ
jgi:hypothetical protein